MLNCPWIRSSSSILLARMDLTVSLFLCIKLVYFSLASVVVVDV